MLNINLQLQLKILSPWFKEAHMKKFLVIGGSILGLIILAVVIFGWHGYSKFMAVETIKYDPQLTIVLGGGGNSIVLTSEDGKQSIVVDTKMADAAKKLRTMVTASDVTVINTHFHRDHVGGNELYPSAHIIAGAYSQEQWKQMAGKNRYPDETIQIGQEKILPFGSETVHVRNLGRAHTWDDVVVYLEKRKLLVTGDILFLGRHPVLFASGGANVGSWISVLDTVQKLYDIKTVVPGHGPVADKSSLAMMRDYFADAEDAAAHPEKRPAFKEKCKALSAMPGMSGPDKTIGFIEQERKVAENQGVKSAR
jgi:glyoxylase-like metal-dependent hydrolase (beta-lactamase superfamily II)